MKSAEVEVNINGKPTKVLLRSLLGKDKSEATRQSSKVTMTGGGTPMVTVDGDLYQQIRLEKSVVSPRELIVEFRNPATPDKIEDSAPLGSIKGLGLLDEDVRDKLQEEASKLTGVHPLERPSSETA